MLAHGQWLAGSNRLCQNEYFQTDNVARRQFNVKDEFTRRRISSPFAESFGVIIK